MMTEASVTAAPGGGLCLAGVLDHRTAGALRAEGWRLIDEQPVGEVSVDCAGIQRSSSVGLSLLLAWMRHAQKRGSRLRICGLPDEMREIARVSGILELLPLEA